MMKTLHVVADSISMHYGPYLEKCVTPWCSYSRKAGQIGNIENPEGANGCQSSIVLDYLNKCLVQGFHWDLIVVNCGLHDIRCFFDGTYQVEITQYETNLQTIFELSHHVADKMIWVRTTPVLDSLHNSLKKDFRRFDSDVQRYNAVADRVALSFNVWRIDLYTLCQAMGLSEIYCDHIHFTDDARKIQGVFVAGQIVASLGLTAV